MTITRANLEVLLIKRCGKVMALVGLDGTTVTGANADLNDPIGYALRKSGISVASITAVSDTDVASVGDDTIDQVLDLAELRALQNIQGNMTGVDFTIGPHSESLSQVGARIEKRIDQLQQQIEDVYGLGLGELSGGVLALSFAEQDDE